MEQQNLSLHVSRSPRLGPCSGERMTERRYLTPSTKEEPLGTTEGNKQGVMGIATNTATGIVVKDSSCGHAKTLARKTKPKIKFEYALHPQFKLDPITGSTDSSKQVQEKMTAASLKISAEEQLANLARQHPPVATKDSRRGREAETALLFQNRGREHLGNISASKTQENTAKPILNINGKARFDENRDNRISRKRCKSMSKREEATNSRQNKKSLSSGERPKPDEIAATGQGSVHGLESFCPRSTVYRNIQKMHLGNFIRLYPEVATLLSLEDPREECVVTLTGHSMERVTAQAQSIRQDLRRKVNCKVDDKDRDAPDAMLIARNERRATSVSEDAEIDEMELHYFISKRNVASEGRKSVTRGVSEKVVVLHDNDVVFGKHVKGELKQSHPGNVEYRALIQQKLHQFYHSSWQERRKVVEAVQKKLRGRFLTKSDSRCTKWTVLTNVFLKNGRILSESDKIRKDFMVALQSRNTQISDVEKVAGDESALTEGPEKKLGGKNDRLCFILGASSSRIANLLIRPELAGQRAKLSDFNKLLLNCIYAYEVTEKDLAAYHSRSQPPSLGQIGFCCRLCQQYTVYPRKICVLGHNMYHIGGHLIGSPGSSQRGGVCSKVPSNLQRRLKEGKPLSTSQSMTKGFIGLPAYLKCVAKSFGVIEHKNGLRVNGEGPPGIGNIEK